MIRVPAAALCLLPLVLLGCDTRPPTAPDRLASPGFGSRAPAIHQTDDTVFADVYDWRFAPSYLIARQGTTVLWEFRGPKGHTVEDVSGLGLYDSGDEGGAGRPGDSLAYRFTSAGRYEFHCDPHPDLMKGVIEVPLEISPVSGVLGAAFLVQWASQVPGAAYAADVQVKRPGQTGFEPWMTGRKDLSASYTPSDIGRYEFRGRLRKTGGATSAWSPSSFVDVVAAGTTNLPPVATPFLSCSGLICGFGDASADPDGVITAWAWDVGDGTQADVPEFLHTYPVRTRFTVSLAVTDDQGAVSVPYTRLFTPFNSAASPVFTHTCTDLTCAFVDVSVDVDGTVVGWSWDFGDGTVDSTPNPTHTFADEGTYGVAFRVLDAAGLWGALDTIPLIVTGGNTGPVPLFTYLCSGLACAFTDLSQDTDGSVVAWSWDFADGATSTEQNPVHTYAVNGDYVVGLAVTDDGGLTSAAFTKVLRPRSPAPVAAFTVACQYLACTFTDASTDGDGAVTAWSWDFGDGVTSNVRSPAHTYAADGSYTVSLTVTDQYGSVSAPVAETRAVAANVAPVAAFTVSCVRLACTFTDGTTDGDGTVAAWSWDFGDGNGSAAASPGHTFGADGTYTVILIATDDQGAASAPATRVVTVAENFAPVAAFTATCFRLACSFADGSSDADGMVVAWSWDFGDGEGATEASPGHGFAAGGSYTVTLRVTDDGGRTGEPAVQLVTVAANQPPTAAFTVACAYRTCTFTDASSDPDGPVATWSWDFGDGTGSTAGSPVHTFGADGSYLVTLTVTDGDGAAGPPAQQAVTVAANQAPVASFTWSCNAGRLCTFDGGGSSDDVGIASYTWLVNGRQFGTGVTATRQFVRPGTGAITLTVTDGLGLTGTSTQNITVP